MAVTRKFLEAMGLEDAKINAIIEEHDKTVNGLKELRDKYKADADKLPEVQKKLDEATANNGDDWKSKYDTLKKTFDDYKAETANRDKLAKTKAAYTKLLEQSNVDPKRIDAIIRITDFADKKLDADGNLENAEELKKSIATEWSAFIQTAGTKGTTVETPPDNKGGATLTRAEIYAKDEHGRYKMSTAERQKALASNPDLWKG